MDSTTEIFLVFVVGDNEDAVGGEGRVEKYQNRMLVDGFNFSMQASENAVRSDDSESSALPTMGTVRVTRPFDIVSNRVSKLLAERTKFDEARLTVDQHMTYGQGAEREQNAIIVFHLLNGHVIDQKFTAREADKGATVSETIELSFKNVAIEYYVLNRSGDKADYRQMAPLPFETQFPDDDDD